MHKSVGTGLRIEVWFALIFIAAFVFRIGVLVMIGIPRMWTPPISWELEWDSTQYLDMAADLSDGVQDSASVRMPVYPVFLNLVSTPGVPFIGAIVANQVMGLAAGMLLFAALRYHSRATAVSAALLSLVFLPYLHYSFKVLPDVMGFAAAALSVLLFSAMQHEKRLPAWIARNILLGLVISLGVLVKPVLQFAALPFILTNLLFRGGRRFAQVLAGCIALVVSAALLPMLWRHHNRASFGLDALSTQDAFEPMARFAILAGETTQEEVWDGSYSDSIARGALTMNGIDYGIRDSLYRAETGRLLSDHFLAVLMPHFTTVYAYASPYEGRKLAGETYGNDDSWLMRIHGWAMVVFGVCCTLGWMLLLGSFFRKPPDRISVFLILWTVVFVVVFGPLRFLRYGLLFYWSMFAAATTGFERLLSSNRRREKAPVTHGEASDPLLTLQHGGRQ